MLTKITRGKSNLLNQKADPSRHHGRRAFAGADVGATLAKLVVRDGDGSLRFRLIPSHAIEQVAAEVEQLRPVRVGLTGGGAPRLDERLSLDTTRVAEFDAWQRGSCALLESQGEPACERQLLVSLGTGTSILLADTDRVRRVGGTALGGGALLGLASLLLDTADFDEVVELAARGDRRRIDLLVSDIYSGEGEPLPGDLNASSFGKLAQPGRATKRDPADLAHALVGLVGENVAGLCAALASAVGAERIVFGGSTLRDNAPLREILAQLSLRDQTVVFLTNGEFAGAVGALALVEAGESPGSEC
jgi:type II pantothenate kinase